MSYTKQAIPAYQAMRNHESLQPYHVEHIVLANHTVKAENRHLAEMAIKASQHVFNGAPGPDCPF